MLGSHLLGIYEKALDGSAGWPALLAKAKRVGFDYLEMSIDEQDSRIGRLFWSDAEVCDFTREVSKSGVPVSSLCLSAHRRFPFGSACGETRERARDLMRRSILLAHRTGIRVIQVAGYDVYYEASTELSRLRFLDGMRYATDFAERYQVMLAVEIMDTPFLNSITAYKTYADMVCSPWFRVYPDLGNLTAWGNDLRRELWKGKDDIVAVHLKDTLAVSDTFPGKFKGVPFGTGCVDFPACFGYLERQGYAGPYLIEMWHDPNANDEDAVRDAAAWIEARFRESVELAAR